jgi:hypothetical protein
LRAHKFSFSFNYPIYIARTNSCAEPAVIALFAVNFWRHNFKEAVLKDKNNLGDIQNLIKIHINFISKAKLMKEYGDMPVSYLCENDELVLLKEVENFKSELELKNAIRKAFRRYRLPNLNFQIAI